MISPVLLVDDLKTFIEEVVKDYWLETNRSDFKKAPQVLTGYLPTKRSTADPDYPFILVRLSEGVDQQQGSTATVMIIIGTYSEDAKNGWRDVANIIQRIRMELLKKRIIANKFSLEYPINYEIVDDQPIPYWVGVITTRWTVAQPVLEVVDFE